MSNKDSIAVLYNIKDAIDDISCQCEIPIKAQHPVLPHCFEDLCLFLFSHVQNYRLPLFSHSLKLGDPVKDKPYNDKRIVVCFSGGLRSLAVVFFYLKLDYEVILYHKGKMTSYISKVSKRLGLKLVHDNHRYKHGHLSNIDVALSALIWCVEHDYPMNVSVGCFTTCPVNSNKFSKNGCNSQELWESFDKILNDCVCSGLHIRRPFPQTFSMWDVLIYHKSYVAESPKLTAEDYVIACDFGCIVPNITKYRKSLMLVKRDYIVNTGIRPKNFNDFWRRCFFYNMSQSVDYERLKAFK